MIHPIGRGCRANSSRMSGRGEDNWWTESARIEIGVPGLAGPGNGGQNRIQSFAPTRPDPNLTGSLDPRLESGWSESTLTIPWSRFPSSALLGKDDNAAQDTPTPGNVTHLLHRIGEGDGEATSELLGVVYDELRGLAGRMFAGGSGVTLQPTALVHDAFLKLVERADDWNDRQHFFAVASLAMRQMLRDAARARSSEKRGGKWERVTLAGVTPTPQGQDVDLCTLDAALTKLSALNERQGRIVELRYLTGLPVAEVAKILSISVSTVGEEWRMARAFLRGEMERSTS